MYRFVSSVILLFIIFPVFGQKWQKAVDKTEKKYLVGRYDKAEKANEKYRKKVQKKLGKTHYYLSDYFVLKNKISLANGTYKTWLKNQIWNIISGSVVKL